MGHTEVGLAEPWLVRNRRPAERLRASLSRLKVCITLFLGLKLFDSAGISVLLVLDRLLESVIVVLGGLGLSTFLEFVVGEVVVEDPFTAKPGANGFTHPSMDGVAFGFGAMVTRDVALLPSLGPEDVLFVPVGGG